MAMAMTEDYYAADMDDVVHRLLPPEILADVGIVVAGCDAPPSSSRTVRRRNDDHAAAVVEDIAAHLVRILRLDAAGEQQRASRPPHLQHPRAGTGYGSRAPAGGGHGAAARHAPPASCWNGTETRVPRFEMADAAVNSHPPARCHGTGVFLPRVEAYAQNVASSASPSTRNGGAKPPRMERREAAVVVAMRRQQLQLLQLRGMEADMQRQREAFAAAFQLHGCPAIAPPQKWTY